MIRHLPLLVLFACSCILTAPGVARAAIARETIDAAHLLVLGRLPEADEIARAQSSGADSLTRLVQALVARVAREPALHAEVENRACRHAFGVDAGEAGYSASDSAPSGYADRLFRRIEHLRRDATAYRAVIARAYRHTVRREPYDIELEYWKAREVLPYFLLCACIENWAVRNQPGLMSTTGTPSVVLHSGHLTAVRITPALADEVRALLGRPTREADAVALACSQVLLAPGAASVVSIGGIHAVAAGRDDRP